MTDKTVVAVRIAPLQGGQYMKGAKVTLAWDGQSKTSTVGNMFAAFPGDMRGRQVEVSVNGHPVGTVSVPISTPNGVATLPIEVPDVQEEEAELELEEGEVEDVGPGRFESAKEKLGGFFGSLRARWVNRSPRRAGSSSTKEHLKKHGKKSVWWILILILFVLAGLAIWKASSSQSIPPAYDLWMRIVLTSVICLATALDALSRRQKWDLITGAIAFAVNVIGGWSLITKFIVGATPAGFDPYAASVVALVAFVIVLLLLLIFAFFGGRDFTVTGSFIAINAIWAMQLKWGAMGVLAGGHIGTTTPWMIGGCILAVICYLSDIIKPAFGTFRINTIIMTMVFFVLTIVGVKLMPNYVPQIPLALVVAVGLLLNIAIAATGQQYAIDTMDQGGGLLQKLIANADRMIKENQYDSPTLTATLLAITMALGFVH